AVAYHDHGRHRLPYQCLRGLRRRQCARADISCGNGLRRVDLSAPGHAGALMTVAASSRSQGFRLDLWWVPRAVALGLLAFVIFGPLTNLVLWTVAEKWYFPHTLPLEYGLSYWG